MAFFFTPPFIFLIFLNCSREANASFPQTKIHKCDSDGGKGVGDLRASAGCEVVVDGADRRETFPSNLHYLAGYLHR